MLRNMGIVDSIGLHSQRALSQFLVATAAASDSFMGFRSVASVFLRGSQAHGESVGLGSSPIDTSGDQNSLHDGSVGFDPELLRDGRGPDPGLVELDNLIHKLGREFVTSVPLALPRASDTKSMEMLSQRAMAALKFLANGRKTGPGQVQFRGFVFDKIEVLNARHVTELPVYDMATKETVYIANGILSSNCQCCFEVVGSGFGVEKEDRIVDRSHIRRAIKKSIMRERKRGTWKNQKQATEWKGADIMIEERPLFNIEQIPSELKQFNLFTTVNAFCPTGEGGGQDNSCSPSNKGNLDYQEMGDLAASLKVGVSDRNLREAYLSSQSASYVSGLADKTNETEDKKRWRALHTDAEANHKGALRALKKYGGDKYLIQYHKETAQYHSDVLGGAGALRHSTYVRSDIGKKGRGGSTRNQFCPTGKDGGVDPTCSPSSTTKGGEDLYSAKRNRSKVWMVGGKRAPEHIQKLGIPPAWTNVEINPDPNGTVLVKGLDSKGRVQTRYSDTHTAKQSAAKFGRTRELIKKRNLIYQELHMDAKDPELKEHAECLKVVMQTGMRPGSEKDTGAEHESFGATTLQGRHVIANKDGTVTLRLATGKNKGREVDFPIADKATATMLRNRAKAAGKYGKVFATTSSQLRDYSKTKDGGGFKTKDHRTALGTETALWVIKRMKAPATESEYKSQVKEVATLVSKTLGNTPPVALKSYIDPQVFVAWNKGLK